MGQLTILDNPVGSVMNGITVITNLYRLGSAEPPNNLPTSAQHPVKDDEIVGTARISEGAEAQNKESER